MGRFAVVSLVVAFLFVASSTQEGRDSYLSIDVIWGVSRSTDGRDQYRLSVTLAPGAVEEIRGHVKLPNGHVVGRLVAPWWSFFTAAGQIDTVRQKQAARIPPEHRFRSRGWRATSGLPISISTT